MLRHVVLLRFHPHVSDDEVAAVTAGLRALPGKVPAIRSYEVGPSLGLAAANGYDFGIVAGFDDEAGWRAYMDDADHAVVREAIAPLAAERAIIQFTS